MEISLLFVTIFLSIISTSIMCYVSMATPIGPWIAPTLVLIGFLCLRLIRSHVETQRLALVVSAGSIGGILATAVGFSFPTLYFLDPITFGEWVRAPWYFIFTLTSLAYVGGSIGMWLAHIVEHQFFISYMLPFSIGDLIYKMILATHASLKKAYELVFGCIATTVFVVLQDGVNVIRPLVPAAFTLVSPKSIACVHIPAIKFDLFPLVWAIGFVTGHVIAVPLIVGVCIRLCIVEPLNRISSFAYLSSVEFTLAFCSGLVLIGFVASFIQLPVQIWRGVQAMIAFIQAPFAFKNSILVAQYGLEGCCVLIIYVLFFSYLGFSFLAQLFIIAATVICVYQMAFIAGKIGLALLGRFATFVMIPAMLLFDLTTVQVVIVATLVEIAGGVAVDVLFGKKVGHLAVVEPALLRRYQYLGLAVSSLAIGIVMWILVSHFQLGSEQLFAQKAQARQLLIQARQFDSYVLLIGMFFGWLLQKLKINSALVFGGLLMPINLVIGLVVGGLATYLTKNKEDWYPFWSGVFAANSIWMVIKALFLH